MSRRRFSLWSWLAVVILVMWQVAAIPTITPTATAAPLAEQPQRMFVDELVAPHPALAVALPSATASDPKAVALDFLRGPGASLVAVADDLAWIPVQSEQFDDVTVVRVSQHKGTVPIWGAELVLQVSGNTVRSLSGAFVPSVAADTKPALDLDEAVKIATLALKNDPPRHDDAELPLLAEVFAEPRLDQHELIFFHPALFEVGDGATALAYRLVLTAPDESASATVVVDAQTGKVWLSFSNYHSGRNRIVRNANGANSTTGAICYTESGPVGIPHPDCVAAFINTGLTYDYFFNTFGRDSFNNAGATMIAVVRYGTVADAFWNGSLTAFGPGFATRDVVAHEWAHAVTQYTAKLIYYGQSGALNESFSDVFGAMVDRDDWLMGEDTPIGAFRSLANPPAYNQPDRVSRYVCMTSDNGGVHRNSGIPNKAAYLMAEGGTFNGRTVPAIGRNATERIFYRALTAYLTSSAIFVDMYNALLAAAGALYGTSSLQYRATLTAAQAVELNVQLPCDAYEPNNTLSTARPITINGAAQRHNFHIAGDQDWVYFDVVNGSSYTTRTFNLGSCGDTVIELYNSSGVLLARNDDYGGTLASRIDFTAGANARMYMKVRHYSSYASGSCTQYNLEVRRVSLSPDAYEPDNAMAQARTFTVNSAGQNRNFHATSDVDWVVFNAAAGSTYTIYTYNLGSEADTVLELYNSNGYLLAYNDDSGSGWASRIVWRALSSGSYFVKIRPYGTTGGRPTSTYSFRIVTGVALSDAEATGSSLMPLITVQNEALTGDQLRLVGVTVDMTPQPGQEFTTLVQAIGRAESYELVVTPKSDSDLVELLAIEPLDPNGQPLAEGAWMAQEVGTGDLAVMAPWQSDQPATLLRLRWRLRATLAEKQWMLPVQVLATNGNGAFWQSMVTVAVPTVASSAKIDVVAPMLVTISSTATLAIRVIGLEGELPRAYLVDLNGQNGQQFAAISYAPGSEDTLIATFDPSFKSGYYKVRLDLSNGSQLFSETVVRLLTSGETVYTVYVPAALR